MATKASCFTFKVLLRPWSGRALVRVRAGLGLCVVVVGRWPSWVAPGALACRCCAVA